MGDAYLAATEDERTEIVGYDGSTGQYALSTAEEVNYVDASEMFELLNRNQVIYVAGSGSIPKMTPNNQIVLDRYKITNNTW